MTDNDKEKRQPAAAPRWTINLPRLLIALAAGAVVTVFVTGRLFAGESFEVFQQNMTATPDWQNILLVNVLVGVCVALFMYQLGWSALRVTATVAVASARGIASSTRAAVGPIRATGSRP